MGLLFAWTRNRRGIAGLAFSAGLWVLSAAALALAMQSNLAVSRVGFDRVAASWGAAFTSLQLLSLLGFAFVLRVAYRLRVALCFAFGAGLVVLGDGLGLLALMFWVGFAPGVG